MQSSYTIGSRTFLLDREKAEAALAAKRVVGGRQTLSFNLLPLRYGPRRRDGRARAAGR